MKIQKQASKPILLHSPQKQRLTPKQYLTKPFKIYILTFLLSELQKSCKQQSLQAIRRCTLHLQLPAYSRGKHKNFKIRTQWDDQSPFQTKQAEVFVKEKQQTQHNYQRQYEYLQDSKGSDRYRYRADQVKQQKKSYYDSEEYFRESRTEGLTNQIGSYGYNQYGSPYRKKRNTAFVEHEGYGDKGYSIVLKDIPISNSKNLRQKQKNTKKISRRTLKTFICIVKSSILRHLSFSFMKISLSSTMKKYEVKYKTKEIQKRQTLTQTHQQQQNRTLEPNKNCNQYNESTQKLGRVSTVFIKLNAIYRYLISITFSRLKSIPIIQTKQPIESIPLQEEILQSENRCVPIESPASDEEQVTIKYIDDESVSGNSILLSSMSLLSFGKEGSSAPFSQRSKETDATFSLD